MRKAFFFALSSLLLTIGMMQPALAKDNFFVINDTIYNVKVDVIFYTHLCSDDHYTLGPKQRHNSYVGLCRVKSFSAIMTDANGKQHQCAGPTDSSYALFRIHRNVLPCGVAHA